MRKLTISTAATAVALAATAGHAELTASLTPSKDNTLYEMPIGNSNGAGPNIFAGRTQIAGVRRGLLAFDVIGALGAGARVNSVSLSMSCDQTQSTLGSFGLHRLTADWGAAGSVGGGTGVPALPGDATWTDRFFGTMLTWTTPGGDFVATPSAAIDIAVASVYTWNSTSALVADVQGWISEPADDFGWLIKEATEVTLFTAKRFGSMENLTPESRPKLTINYNKGGDATLDDRVNLADFNILASNFGQSGRTFEEGDFNLDTLVNLADFNILASNFGFAAAPGAAPTPQEWATLVSVVPEPAAAAVLVLNAWLLARRRQR